MFGLGFVEGDSIDGSGYSSDTGFPIISIIPSGTMNAAYNSLPITSLANQVQPVQVPEGFVFPTGAVVIVIGFLFLVSIIQK